MQHAKLFAYVNNNNIDIKRILQDKQFHLEQKEIIQNVLERKDSMAVLPTGFGKSICYVLSPHFGQGKIIFVFLVVICNSLLLLKSLPINVINCIQFYVNCSALTGAYDWQYKYLFVCLYANHLP
jgi:ATP-dependent DNA helicase RecQ